MLPVDLPLFSNTLCLKVGFFLLGLAGGGIGDFSCNFLLFQKVLRTDAVVDLNGASVFVNAVLFSALLFLMQLPFISLNLSTFYTLMYKTGILQS